MSEEIEKISGDKSEGKESKTLDQDDISKLIDEMQSEENSSETEDQAEKITDDEAKQESDETKDDESEDQESNTLLVDAVKNEEKLPEIEETEDTTEHVEKDNEDEKNVESEIPLDENTQTAERNDNVQEKELKEKAESQEQDENSSGEDKKSEKEAEENDKKEENDEEDNGNFSGLDSDDEIEIDGEPETESETEPKTGPDPDSETETEKDQSDNEDNHHKSKENDEDKDKRTQKDDGEGEAAILKEVKKKSNGKRFKLLVACISSIVFIAVLFGVYTIFKKSGTDIIKVEKPFKPEQVEKPGNKFSEEQTRQQIKGYETKDILLNDSIIAKIEEISKLRNELLIKKREIADLIKNNKDGISKMEDEILRVKQNNKIKSFSGAIKDKKIEFGMMTIKRRLEYIEKIDPPYMWLNHGIEELLYLKHKIEIDAQISSVISGIDMDKMIEEIDIVIKRYRTGIEKLEINMKNVGLMSLEMIWKRIIDKENFANGNNGKSGKTVGINKPIHTNEENNNRMIWEEICSGDFKRKNEMTKLSTGAAKCLSKWEHPDLFLNGTSELPPEVARYLFKWKGNWICLNGVKELSPEAAKHLFQWQGNWISLNGLSEISSGLLNYLSQWQGKQIELMGLKYKGSKSERAGLKSLEKWEKSGGKLYIPVKIRNVINKL